MSRVFKFIILILIMFFIGCSDSKKVAGEFIPYKTGDEITLKSVTNKDITLIRTKDGFKLKDSDKIIIFDIFATYCPPCRSEAAALMDFAFKNKDVQLIGLITYEDVSNEFVINNFIKKYNAYYFISNSKDNERIIKQILNDLKYNTLLKIPFKVVLANGVYQKLSDITMQNDFSYYYLGALNTKFLQSDINRIKNEKR